MGHQPNYSPRASLVRFPRERTTHASRAGPERRIGLVEAIADSAVGAMRGHAPALFDDFVGADQNRVRHRKAESLSGLEVHGHLELGRKLHREIARLLAAQYAIYIRGGATTGVYGVGSVGQQTAVSGKGS